MKFDQTVEIDRVIAVGVELFNRHAHVVASERRSRLADQHETVAVGVRQRFQQDAVNDAEDRRVGADAETEGRDRQQREPAILRERPEAEAEIVQQLIEHVVSPWLRGRGASDIPRDSAELRWKSRELAARDAPIAGEECANPNGRLVSVVFCLLSFVLRVYARMDWPPWIAATRSSSDRTRRQSASGYRSATSNSTGVMPAPRAPTTST